MNRELSFVVDIIHAYSLEVRIPFYQLVVTRVFSNQQLSLVDSGYFHFELKITSNLADNHSKNLHSSCCDASQHCYLSQTSRLQ